MSTAGLSNDPRPDPGATGRGIGLLRLAFAPTALIAAAAEPVRLETDLFPATLSAFAAYAVASMLVRGRAEGRLRFVVVPAAVDLCFIAALIYTTGGARSPLLFALYVLPTGAAVRLSPKVTAVWSAASIAVFLIVAVPHPLTELSRDADLVLARCLTLAWIGAAAVMLSALVARREQALASLVAARGLLVRRALDAEARERRRLAQALHDGAIQNILLARQEVADLALGVEGAEQRAQRALDETTRQLREEVFAMHPVGLERAGLGPVLRGLAEDAALRGGFRPAIRIDPVAERRHDDVIVAVARELLTNAAKHAHARRVAVGLAAEGGALRLTVSDDGAGFVPARLEQAASGGHIGLAAADERVRAIGGRIDIRSAPGEGTTIDVCVPDQVPPEAI